MYQPQASSRWHVVCCSSMTCYDIMMYTKQCAW